MVNRAANVPDIFALYASAGDAVDHAIAVLSAELAKARFAVGKGETKLYLELRRDLPYMIHETSLSGVKILVNRNYKPLGNASRTGQDWDDYAAATSMHVHLTDEQIRSVQSPSRERSMFGDGNPPWHGRREAAEYRERLVKLRSYL